MNELVGYWALVTIVSTVISAVIGANKGNPIGGAFLGLMVGPLGVIVVLLSEDKNRIPCRS